MLSLPVALLLVPLVTELLFTKTARMEDALTPKAGSWMAARPATTDALLEASCWDSWEAIVKLPLGAREGGAGRW